MQQVIIIYGPTAVGKSAIAVELAKLINGEIISADSMQIYKHLNIGSAKVTPEEMQDIKHYMIDFLEPSEDYSVAQYVKDTHKCINQILSNNKIPIIVGGTGLYLKALVENYDFSNVNKNQDFRDSLKDYSTQELFNKLQSIDKNIKIDSNNRNRIIRALEILSTEKNNNENNNNQYDYKVFAICDDRQKIYERINLRVDKMIEQGLISEAEFLKSLNLSENCLSMKAIGYKELFPYLNNEKTLEECKDILKQKSRNYAKRQFTFMNQFKNLHKVNFTGVKNTALNIKQILEV